MAGSGFNPIQEKDRPSTSHSPSEAATRRWNILIVEDNKADVFIIQEALENARIDAALRIINDGSSATEFIDAVDRGDETLCPDVVLLDLNLPRKNVDDVLRHLRDSTRCKDAPVMIVSSSDAPPDRNAVSGLSVAGWFKKPSGYAEYMKLGPLVKDLLESTL
jgi:CheY-like chemotaxis protein